MGKYLLLPQTSILLTMAQYATLNWHATLKTSVYNYPLSRLS